MVIRWMESDRWSATAVSVALGTESWSYACMSFEWIAPVSRPVMIAADLKTLSLRIRVWVRVWVRIRERRRELSRYES